MRFAARLLPVAAAASALLSTAGAAAAADPACLPPAGGQRLLAVPAASTAEAVPGEVVVRYRDGAAADRGTRRLADVGARGRRIGSRVAVVRLPGGTALRTATAALRRDPDVLWAEPNYVYRAERMPNDEMFASQWALHIPDATGADIDAPQAWDVTTGSPSVLVAVVDTGVDGAHPDLAPNLAVNPGESGDGREANGVDDDGNGLVDDVRGWDFAADDNDPTDTFGHGTHVAGTIGARGNDGLGVTGVAWQTGLLALRALDDRGLGSSIDIAAAMTYAAARGARIVNVSLGGAGYSQAMLDAICGAPNTLFVVAAGNSSDDVEQKPFYPCAYTAANIVCVAATDDEDELAAFSNHGTASVDLAAPGTAILSTVPGGNYATYSGTSMASPHVAGAAALLFAQRPEWTPAQVKEALLAGTDPLPSLTGAVLSGGRLDAARALAVAGATADPTVITEPAAAVGTTSATLVATANGGIDGGTLRFEYGETVELGTATPEVPVTGGAGALRLTHALAGLAPATTYHVRAVLVTPAGEVAGETRIVTTAAARISAATGAATAAGTGAARLTGTVRAGDGATYRFEFGETRRYGRATPARRVGGAAQAVTVDALARGLRPGRRYHYRLVVTGPNGTVRGADRSVVVGTAALRVRTARAVGDTLRITVRVPGPGRVTVVATGRADGAAVTLGSAARTTRAGGLHTLLVRLSPKAKALRAASGRTIAVTVTFRASGGRAAAGRTVQVSTARL